MKETLFAKCAAQT